ncbi:MAG: hypothetical protein ACI4S3_07515, partial [Candidatus Gastranaerophilaceae bacterium]
MKILNHSYLVFHRNFWEILNTIRLKDILHSSDIKYFSTSNEFICSCYDITHSIQDNEYCNEIIIV